MAGIKFSTQIKAEMGILKSKISEAVTGAGLAAWTEAVNSTPVETGTLRGNWGISNDRRSSYIPVRRKQGRPARPNFRFRATMDKRVYLFNNVPYASYVENGEGRGVRIARLMLKRATMVFENELNRRLGAIR